MQDENSSFPKKIQREIVSSKEEARVHRTPTKTQEYNYDPLLDKNRLSNEEMWEYFATDANEDLKRLHGHEWELLEKYSEQKQSLGTYNEFEPKIRQYKEAWTKFEDYCRDKQEAWMRAIWVLSELSEETRQFLTVQFESIRNNQKMMDFAREKLCSHFHSIQIDELRNFVEQPSEFSQKIDSLLEQGHIQGERLETFANATQDDLGALWALLSQIQGKLPNGGLEMLCKMSENPGPRGLEFIKKFLALNLNGVDFQIFTQYFYRKRTLAQIGEMLRIDKSTVSRHLTIIEEMMIKQGLKPDVLKDINFTT